MIFPLGENRNFPAFFNPFLRDLGQITPQLLHWFFSCWAVFVVGFELKPFSENMKDFWRQHLLVLSCWFGLGLLFLARWPLESVFIPPPPPPPPPPCPPRTPPCVATILFQPDLLFGFIFHIKQGNRKSSIFVLSKLIQLAKYYLQ